VAEIEVIAVEEALAAVEEARVAQEQSVIENTTALLDAHLALAVAVEAQESAIVTAVAEHGTYVKDGADVGLDGNNPVSNNNPHPGTVRETWHSPLRA
jgi:hypothetical protein